MLWRGRGALLYPCRARIEYFYSPLPESGAISAAAFRRSIDLIQKITTGGKLLVHCTSGVSRSPVVIATYMHVAGEDPFYGALTRLKALRVIVSPENEAVESAVAYLNRMEYAKKE